MPYQIRAAAGKDLNTVYQFISLLEETSFDFEIFKNIFEENINNKNYVYLVAESGSDGIIGFISCHIQLLLHHCGKVAEIQELFVKETNRNDGIGRLLVEEMEKILKAEKCLSFEVTAQNKREQTHRFYESLQFQNTHKKFVKDLLGEDIFEPQS